MIPETLLLNTDHELTDLQIEMTRTCKIRTSKKLDSQAVVECSCRMERRIFSKNQFGMKKINILMRICLAGT